MARACDRRSFLENLEKNFSKGIRCGPFPDKGCKVGDLMPRCPGGDGPVVVRRSRDALLAQVVGVGVLLSFFFCRVGEASCPPTPQRYVGWGLA